MKMYKRLIAFALILLAATVPAWLKQPLKLWQQKALSLVKKEKEVLDAFWRNPERNVLFVAMKPGRCAHAIVFHRLLGWSCSPQAARHLWRANLCQVSKNTEAPAAVM